MTHLAGVAVLLDPASGPAAYAVIAAIVVTVVARVTIPARIIAVAIVSVVGRTPVPGIVIPGRIIPRIPGIIPAPGTVIAVMAPGAVIPRIPVPGIPVCPGRIVPGAVVAAQVPGAIGPGIVPAVIVKNSDVRPFRVETKLRYLAFGNDDRIARCAQDVYFRFDGLLHQGVHLLLGNGGYGSLRTGIRIDAVFELLRARSELGGRAAGNRGEQTQQVGSQMLFHVRTSFLSNKISIFVPE